MAINISNILKTKPDDIFYKEYIEKIKKWILNILFLWYYIPRWFYARFNTSFR
jgi:hypothetical protein